MNVFGEQVSHNTDVSCWSCTVPEVSSSLVNGISVSSLWRHVFDTPDTSTFGVTRSSEVGTLATVWGSILSLSRRPLSIGVSLVSCNVGPLPWVVGPPTPCLYGPWVLDVYFIKTTDCLSITGKTLATTFVRSIGNSSLPTRLLCNLTPQPSVTLTPPSTRIKDNVSITFTVYFDSSSGVNNPFFSC